METGYFKNNPDVVAKLRRQSYLAEITHVIDLLGQYCKSKIVVDGSLLSVEIYDEFGGRYDLTVDCDEDFKRFYVSLWFNGESRFRSSFTNLSFAKRLVEMLLDWYIIDDEDVIL